MKNCLPYWMPTAYRNSARPSVPTIGAGADFGANQPMARATKSTAPDAERKSLDVDLADQVADGDGEKQRHQRLLFEQAS